MNHRLDLATSVHKCVRKVLCDQAMLLARADYRDEASCREAYAALERAFFLLREHGGHEDEVIVPVISQLNSALAFEAARQHAAIEQHMREIERVAVGLRLATSAERARPRRAQLAVARASARTRGVIKRCSGRVLLGQLQRAARLQPELASALGHEPQLRTFLLEPLAQQDQAALQVVLDRR
jgi:hypothetical protein